MHATGDLGGRRRGAARRPLTLVAGVLLAVAALTMVDLGSLLPDLRNPFATEQVDRSQPPLLQAIEDLSEYKAATGHFESIVDVEDDTRFVPSFIKGERTVFVAAGTVDATVDFSGLPAGAIEVSPDGRSVVVTVPAATLSDPRIDSERSRVVSRDRGVLDRVGSVFSDSPTGERELYLLAEGKLAVAAQGSDLRERAEANTRRMLTGMLGSLGYDDVTITFERPRT